MRHNRIRRRVVGTQERPRLSVYRSLQHIYAQLIDDSSGRVLAAASSRTPSIRGQRSDLKRVEVSRLVGKTLAEQAKTRGISKVAFDRGGYKYHGLVKALAEGSREGGLEF